MQYEVAQGAEKESVQQTAKVETGEIPEEELYGTIPELEDLHGAIYTLWHTAYPQKDYDRIETLLPRLDSLTAKLDEAPFPRILHMKREAWDKAKEDLKGVLQKLHQAVEADDRTEILGQTEAFHSAFQNLPRAIRPFVPELEAFHRELYKIVHYYLPNTELDRIRETVVTMQEKLRPLEEAELPESLAVRSGDFANAVKELGAEVESLAEISIQDDMSAIEAAVKELHTAYQNAYKLLR